MHNSDGDMVGVFFLGIFVSAVIIFLLFLPVTGIENHCDDLGSLTEHKTLVINRKCTVEMGNNLWVPVEELSLVQKTK